MLGLVAALALAGFVALAPAARADHDTLPWSSPGFVTQNTEFSRAFATTFADGQGSLYVFYDTTSIATGLTNLNVTKYATHSSLDLPRILWDKQVNSATNTVLSGPASVARDHEGNVYAAYSEDRGSGANVYVSTLPAGSTTWSTEVLASTPGGTNTKPALAVTPSGTVYVAWQQSFSTATNLTVASSTDGGATFGTPTNITRPGASGITEVSATSDAAGHIYVISDFFDRSKGYYVTNLSRSVDGTTWDTPVTLSNVNSDAFDPSVYADKWGSVHAVWIDHPGGIFHLYYSRSSDGGDTWSVPIALNDATVGVLTSRTSIAESGGTLMVGWTSFHSAAPTSFGLGFAISADRGSSWYPAEYYTTTGNFTGPQLTADENGTFYAAPVASAPGVSAAPRLLVWLGPSSPPTITGIARGTGQLTVSWSAPPEANVVGYRVYRSTDGTSFSFVASVPASDTSYVDGGLANGQYWYEVVAVNDEGILSHPATGTAFVGLSSQEQIAQLQGEIAALQQQIATLQGNASANSATLAQLQSELKNLQDQLNALQGQQATQTISYANLAFEIIVVVLLVIVLLNQMRKPKSPQLMMAQPGQVQTPPRQPEDDL